MEFFLLCSKSRVVHRIIRIYYDNTILLNFLTSQIALRLNKCVNNFNWSTRSAFPIYPIYRQMHVYDIFTSDFYFGFRFLTLLLSFLRLSVST